MTYKADLLAFNILIICNIKMCQVIIHCMCCLPEKKVSACLCYLDLLQKHNILLCGKLRKKRVRLNGARIYYFPFYIYARKTIVSRERNISNQILESQKKKSRTSHDLNPSCRFCHFMLSKKSFVHKINVTFNSMIIYIILRLKFCHSYQTLSFFYTCKQI